MNELKPFENINLNPKSFLEINLMKKEDLL